MTDRTLAETRPTAHLLLRSARLAWIGVVRQPLRTALAVLGVAAIGALLFDMLLLSRGLVLSFRDLLDEAGYDVRVLATDLPPLAGPPITDAAAVAASVARLPEVEAVLRIRIRSASLESAAQAPLPGRVGILGIDPTPVPPWTLLEGRNLEGAAGVRAPAIVNGNVQRRLGVAPGDVLSLSARCPGAETLPPMTFTIVGVASFPFDDGSALTVAGTLDDLARLCPGTAADDAEMLMVRSAPESDAPRAAAAIRGVHPALHVVTNEELIERFSRVEFSYFRQISFVLSAVTLFFGFLLIAVLLTVSVNGRLGEIAALRALGLTRGRVAAGIFVESLVLVGAGGLLAIPLGVALSVWLERILHRMPGIPVGVSFFVFEPRMLLVYAALLAAAALGAAVYPVRVVSTLPIAATLRREVVS